MSNNEQDQEFREIVTKAVCGKGRKFTQATHTVTPSHAPSSILGCWIINHEYNARKRGENVEISGTYDANLWYSYNDNTKTEVVTEEISYHDVIRLSSKDENCISDDLEVIARVLQQPNCLEATISPNGNKVVVQVEREFLAEVIGETKVSVQVFEGVIDEVEELPPEEDIDDNEFDDLDPNFLYDGEEE